MKKKVSILLSFVLMLTLAFSSVIYADYDPKPTNITKLSATKKTVKVGKKFELRAFTSPYDCEDDYLVWDTSDKKVVAFEDYDRTGDEMDFVAKKAGHTKITIRAKANKKIKKVVYVYVEHDY